MLGMDEDEFIFVSEFDDDSLESFYRNFARLEADDSMSCVPVIISSYGGDVAALVGMRDLIKSCEKPVATIALGKAMSAGAALLAAGTKELRFASPSSLIMIHEVQSGAQGRPADLLHEADLVKALNDQLFNLLAEDIGRPVEALLSGIRAREHANWYLTAQQAKQLGLVDHVEVPRLVPGGVMSNLVRTTPFRTPKKGKGRA